jgi:DeoR/GlpR family transcriptional regulator of sugar metabolism
MRLHLLGKEYNPATNFLGAITERTVEVLDFDAVFVECDALDDAGRCLVVNPFVARLSEVMITRGRWGYLLGDHTKVGAHSCVVCAKLNGFDVCITTLGIRPTQLEFFRPDLG